MKELAKRVGVLALAMTMSGLSLTPAATAGILKHEKSSAARQRQAFHKARKAEKKTQVKKHLFSHH
jgi:hypothetical protein